MVANCFTIILLLLLLHSISINDNIINSITFIIIISLNITMIFIIVITFIIKSCVDRVAPSMTCTVLPGALFKEKYMMQMQPQKKESESILLT